MLVIIAFELIRAYYLFNKGDTWFQSIIVVLIVFDNLLEIMAKRHRSLKFFEIE